MQVTTKIGSQNALVEKWGMEKQLNLELRVFTTLGIKIGLTHLQSHLCARETYIVICKEIFNCDVVFVYFGVFYQPILV